MAVVFLAQIIGGILLLAGRFVPLGLAILAPVLVNILDYHITMNPGGHWSWIGRDDSVVACLPALSDQLRSNLSAAFVAKD
jgi:hypothetical protein